MVTWSPHTAPSAALFISLKCLIIAMIWLLIDAYDEETLHVVAARCRATDDGLLAMA